MPAYNFQKRFVPAVESGLKLSTIRGNARGAAGRYRIPLHRAKNVCLPETR